MYRHRSSKTSGEILIQMERVVFRAKSFCSPTNRLTEGINLADQTVCWAEFGHYGRLAIKMVRKMVSIQ